MTPYLIFFVGFCFGFSVAVILCLIVANSIKLKGDNNYNLLLETNKERNALAEKQNGHLELIAYEIQLLRQAGR